MGIIGRRTAVQYQPQARRIYYRSNQKFREEFGKTSFKKKLIKGFKLLYEKYYSNKWSHFTNFFHKSFSPLLLIQSFQISQKVAA
jgi:hypothetical protein